MSTSKTNFCAGALEHCKFINSFSFLIQSLVSLASHSVSCLFTTDSLYDLCKSPFTSGQQFINIRDDIANLQISHRGMPSPSGGDVVEIHPFPLAPELLCLMLDTSPSLCCIQVLLWKGARRRKCWVVVGGSRLSGLFVIHSEGSTVNYCPGFIQ